MTFAEQLEQLGLGETAGERQAAFSRLVGRDPRTVRQWCQDGPPAFVSALLAACRELEPEEPKKALVRLLESAAQPTDGAK